MANNNISRRKFLALGSLTSLAVLPGIKALAKLTGVRDIPAHINACFRLSGMENMVNLDFYFIGVDNRGRDSGYLAAPQTHDGGLGSSQSFMIVRLPQQHIAESFIDAYDLTDCTKLFRASTRIAGYSYLVFQLFFTGNDGAVIPAPGFMISQANFLDWNASHLKLIVREDRAIAHPLFNVVGYSYNQYPFGYTNTGSSLEYNREKFPQYPAGNNPTGNIPAPVTVIEAPYRLILSPELPNHSYIFKWSFSRSLAANYNLKSDLNGRELWMATLQVIRDAQNVLPAAPVKDEQKNKLRAQKQKTKPVAIRDEKPTDEPIKDLPMELAIIGSPDYRENGAIACPGTFNSLPNADDRRQLVELYFLAQTVLKAKTRKLAFTPLGICGTMEFTNVLIERIMARKNNLDLFQWKQSISFGRDMEVEVVNLMKDLCTCHTVLHIRSTKRRTVCGVSLLEYNEYLQPLDDEKNYLLYNQEDAPIYTAHNYKFNTPFKSIRFASTKPKRILSIKNYKSNHDIVSATNTKSPERLRQCPPPSADPDAVESANLLAFWAKKPDQQSNDVQGDYLEWEYIATDWHDNEIKLSKKMFLVSSRLNGTSKQSDKNFTVPELTGLQNLKTALENRMKPDATVIPELQDKVKTFTAIEQQLLNEWSSVEKQGAEWKQIFLHSEQFLLEKADMLRQHLENTFTEIDQEVARRYQSNPDWIDGQDEFEESLQKFKTDFYNNILNNYLAVKTAIDNLKNEAIDFLGHTDADIRQLGVLIRHCTALPGDFLDKIFQQAEPRITNLTFKTRYHELQNVLANFNPVIDNFIQSVPARLDLQNIIRAKFMEAKQVYCFIEHVESSCKSKIDTFKSKIGVAVYRVENGLDDFKQELKDKLKDKWEPVYKTVEDYYHRANKEISSLTTQAIIFRNNVRLVTDESGKKAMDFFHYDAVRQQLHSQQCSLQKVNDAVHHEVLLRVSMADDYLKGQVDNVLFNVKNNAMHSVLRVHEEAKHYLQGSMREIGSELGGIVNPSFAADLVSYYHESLDAANETVEKVTGDAQAAYQNVRDSTDQLKAQFNQEFIELHDKLNDQLNDFKQVQQELMTAFKAKKDELQNQFNIQKNKLVLIGKNLQGEANKSLGAVKDEAKNLERNAVDFFKGMEGKILGSLKWKDILDLGAAAPKLNKTNKSLYYSFATQKIKSVNIGAISFTATEKTRFVCYFEKSLLEAKRYISQTTLENFTLGVFGDRILVEFKKLEIVSNQDVKNKTNVSIGNVTFQKELAFLQALSKNIKVPGTGILLNITPEAILASYSYTFPSIIGGAFSMANLKFNTGVTVPFPIGGGKLKPIRASFGINAPDDKFVIAAGIYGGRGHFVLETTPRYISKIDCSFEFGGYFGISLGIASGQAYLMAGIRYVFSRDEVGQSSMRFYGYITAGGSVTVFGFITVSVCFILCMTYEKTAAGSSLYGTASVSMSVKIGFFEKSFTLTFTKRMAGSDNAGASTTMRRHRNELNNLADPENNNVLPGNYIHYANYNDQGDAAQLKQKTVPMFTEELWKSYCLSFF